MVPSDDPCELHPSSRVSFAVYPGNVKPRDWDGLTMTKIRPGGSSLLLRAARKWLCLVQSKGAGDLRGQRAEVSLSCGELAFMFVQEELVITGDNACELCIVAFDAAPAWLQMADSGAGSAHLDGRSPSHLLVAGLVERLVDDVPPSDGESGQAISQSLIGLMSMALKEGNLHGRLPYRGLRGISRKQIEEHIELHLRDPELSVEFLEVALGWSKRTLYRAFGDGGQSETISRYIWRRRVERAAELLRTGDRNTLTDIAYSLGFSSSSHFSRLFKEYAKLAPHDYRQQCRPPCAVRSRKEPEVELVPPPSPRVDGHPLGVRGAA